MLNVARSTIIGALDRLVADGILLRRQGSGTFLQRLPIENSTPHLFQSLVPQAEIADAQGREMRVGQVTVDDAAAPPPDIAAILRCDDGARVCRVERLMMGADGPCAVFTDHLAPDAPLPHGDRLVQLLERGESVLDLLLAAQVPVAFARTTVLPTIVTPDSERGERLGVHQPSAAFEVVETTHLVDGSVAKHSHDVVLDGAWHLHLLRHLGPQRSAPPVPLPPRGGARRPDRLTGGETSDTAPSGDHASSRAHDHASSFPQSGAIGQVRL